MPRLQETIAVLGDHSHQDSKFMSSKFRRRNQPDWIKRELRQSPIALNMNMSRLGAFVAEKEEPIRPNSRNSRH
jgi:hypothetical protein